MEKYPDNFSSPQVFNSSSRKFTSVQSEPETSVELQQETDRVHVYIRIRPQFKEERREQISVNQLNSQTLSIEAAVGPKDLVKEFTFSQIFPPKSTQQEIFKITAQPLVEHVLAGYNGTYFVYGQTGTGKTYTMGVLQQLEHKTQGIIPSTLDFIFQYLHKQRDLVQFSVHLSFFQIYLEQISDLLNPENKNMQIREEQGEVFIHDLVEVPVRDIEQALNLINAGLTQRVIASQNMNETSSRSHTILHIDIEQQKQVPDGVQIIQGRLVLADLAGSERVRRTTSTGVRLEEAKHINASLSALGNVVSGLAAGQTQFIPYRSSKLTRVLTNSLSVNSKIVVLCTLGPSSSNYNETLSTLLFAKRCQEIVLKPKGTSVLQNHPPELQIQKLLSEIEQIRYQHQQQTNGLTEQIVQKENQRQQLEQQVYQQSLELVQLKSDLQHARELLKQAESKRQVVVQPEISENKKRARMVADMTTFMAKLVSKLTQTAVTYANNVIKKTEEANSKLGESYARTDPIKLQESEMINFQSNTQLLDDENLSIPAVVQQIQSLAKKHVECLTLMHTFCLNQLDNSQRLLTTNKTQIDKIESILDEHSRDATTILTYSINHLSATEDQIKAIISQIGATVDRQKLLTLVRNYPANNSQFMQPVQSQKAIIKQETTTNSQQYTTMRSVMQVQTPVTPGSPLMKNSFRNQQPESPLKLLSQTSAEEDYMDLDGLHKHKKEQSYEEEEEEEVEDEMEYDENDFEIQPDNYSIRDSKPDFGNIFGGASEQQSKQSYYQSSDDQFQQVDRQPTFNQKGFQKQGNPKMHEIQPKQDSKPPAKKDAFGSDNADHLILCSIDKGKKAFKNLNKYFLE